MMTLGVDYPWTHPDPAALQSAGVAFAMRYLSTDPSKNLSRAEAEALAAHGIWCGVVWETTAGRALAGYAAGVSDAHTAAAQAAACGMPGSRPIYFAVDTDTDWPSVQPYFAGVTSVLGASRTGVYGGLRIVQGAAGSGLVSWFWQASAWSGGVWDGRAHIRQPYQTVTIGGVDCDRDEAMTSDYGQWMPGISPEADVTPDELLNTKLPALPGGYVPSVSEALHGAAMADDKIDKLPTDLLNAPMPEYARLPGGYLPTVGEVLNGGKLADEKIGQLAQQVTALGQQLVAQAAALTAVVQQFAAAHPGVDTAAVVAAVQAAIAAATVHVDVHVDAAPKVGP